MLPCSLFKLPFSFFRRYCGGAISSPGHGTVGFTLQFLFFVTGTTEHYVESCTQVDCPCIKWIKKSQQVVTHHMELKSLSMVGESGTNIFYAIVQVGPAYSRQYPVGQVCICRKGQGRMYLAAKDHIPAHNSQGNVFLYLVASSKKQLSREE